jgi:hypothetical protein
MPSISNFCLRNRILKDGTVFSILTHQLNSLHQTNGTEHNTAVVFSSASKRSEKRVVYVENLKERNSWDTQLYRKLHLKTWIVRAEETSIATQRLGKHVPVATNTQATIDELTWTMFSVRSVQSGYKRRELVIWYEARDPYGGGVEYPHRDPASHRRRREGKSRNWDSKIWSPVPRDSNPRKTALARANSMYKNRPVLRQRGHPTKSRP